MSGPSDWPQEQLSREVRPAPDRYRNVLGKYKIDRLASCKSCGRCVEVCRYGVHERPEGYAFTLRPQDHLCIGPECADREDSCVAQCPNKALVMRRNPSADCMGDPRWPSDLILSTWHEAATGHAPPPHLEYRYGASGGGFDRLRFKFEVHGLDGAGGPPEESRAAEVGAPSRPAEPGRTPGAVPEGAAPSDAVAAELGIDTGLDLNRRGDSRPQVHIDIPVYGGGMSFGSVSIHTILGKARAATAWNSFTCTGEGGYPDRLRPYDDHVITQVATGLFGVREETVQRVRIVEFKYAQGAKPGLGGHLLGDKNTPPVARMREAVAGNALFSPFPFHSVYSVEDHKKHVDWIKEMNPDCLVSVKVSTPTDVDMVAVGSYYAGAHIVHLDGSYGGTGAAPDIAKKNIAMPIEYAIPKVHKFLVGEGIRDQVTLIASGGIRCAYDVLKAIALGADGVVIGTAEMVALGCVRCACCESGRGCPRGIATTDPELMMQMSLEWATQRLINLQNAWREQIIDVLGRLGMKSIAELRGRRDLLCYLSDEPAAVAAAQASAAGAAEGAAADAARVPVAGGEALR
jgi:ferredoxin